MQKSILVLLFDFHPRFAVFSLDFSRETCEIIFLSFCLTFFHFFFSSSDKISLHYFSPKICDPFFTKAAFSPLFRVVPNTKMFPHAHCILVFTSSKKLVLVLETISFLSSSPFVPILQPFSTRHVASSFLRTMDWDRIHPYFWCTPSTPSFTSQIFLQKSSDV